MKKNKNIINSTGFSLLEVLLSVTILSLILFTMMSFFSQSFQYTKNNESKTVGINVARNVLNYIEKQNFDVILQQLSKTQDTIILNSDSNDLNAQLLTGNYEGVFETKVNNILYSATVEIQKHPEQNLQDYLIPVTVTIYWGNNKETTLKGGIKK